MVCAGVAPGSDQCASGTQSGSNLAANDAGRETDRAEKSIDRNKLIARIRKGVLPERRRHICPLQRLPNIDIWPEIAEDDRRQAQLQQLIPRHNAVAPRAMLRLVER